MPAMPVACNRRGGDRAVARAAQTGVADSLPACLQVQTGIPGIGEFQCYDAYMLANLAAWAKKQGKPDWCASCPLPAAAGRRLLRAMPPMYRSVRGGFLPCGFVPCGFVPRRFLPRRFLPRATHRSPLAFRFAL
jgi:hypothetical protein